MRSCCPSVLPPHVTSSPHLDIGLDEGALGFDGGHVQSWIVPGQAGLSVAGPVRETQLRGRGDGGGGGGAPGLPLVEPLTKVTALLLEGGTFEVAAKALEVHH